MMEIEQKINNLIIKHMGSKGEEKIIQPEMNLVDDFYYNSLELITLLVSIEEEFNIEFNEYDENISSLMDISYLLQVIRQKVKNNNLK